MQALFYSHAGITIYHADCRDILPHLPQVDLLCTDPPYGIGEAAGKNKSRGKMATAKDYGNSEWDDGTVDQSLLDQCIQKAKYSIVFGGNFYQLPPSSCWLVWDKDNGNTDFADCELAWTNLPKAVRRLRYRWHGMLQEHMGRNKEVRVHPTQKPLAVMHWCIRQAPESCKMICDPFCGSGSTLRAAKDLGRNCIGIEREERYAEIAANRLSQRVLDFS